MLQSLQCVVDDGVGWGGKVASDSAVRAALHDATFGKLDSEANNAVRRACGRFALNK